MTGIDWEEVKKWAKQKEEDSKHFTPEEMQAKYKDPKEWYEKYHAFGFEYEFQPHFLFQCNKVVWRIKDLYDTKYALGTEQNSEGVYDRCHAAVRRMIAFIGNEIKPDSEDILYHGVLYKVGNDWVWIGKDKMGNKIAYMGDSAVSVKLDVRSLYVEA